MTDQEISEAVALKLGAKKLKECACGDPYDDHWELPHEWNYRKFAKNFPPYCRSTEAAWVIVEKLKAEGFRTNMTVRPFGEDKKDMGYHVQFIKDGSFNGEQDWGETAAMAICRAFLKLP